MDIIITIPKDKISEEASRAAMVLEALGHDDKYYIAYPFLGNPPVEFGDKVFVVEDGNIVGYYRVQEVEHSSHPVIGTADVRDEKSLVILDILSWQSINPIPMLDFSGWKVAGTFPYTRIGDGCFDIITKLKVKK